MPMLAPARCFFLFFLIVAVTMITPAAWLPGALVPPLEYSLQVRDIDKAVMGSNRLLDRLLFFIVSVSSSFGLTVRSPVTPTLSLSQQHWQSPDTALCCSPACHGRGIHSSSSSAVSPIQNSKLLRMGHTTEYPQCLLRMSAGLISPGMWW